MPKPERMKLDDVKICDCCQCGRYLLGESMEVLSPEGPEASRKLLPIGVKDFPFVGKRIVGRPWCVQCLAAKRLRELRAEGRGRGNACS